MLSQRVPKLSRSTQAANRSSLLIKTVFFKTTHLKKHILWYRQSRVSNSLYLQPPVFQTFQPIPMRCVLPEYKTHTRPTNIRLSYRA